MKKPPMKYESSEEERLPQKIRKSRQGKGGGGLRSTSFKKGDPRCITKGTFKKGHVPAHKGKILKVNLTQQKIRRILAHSKRYGSVNLSQIHHEFREFSRKSYRRRKILRALGLSS